MAVGGSGEPSFNHLQSATALTVHRKRKISIKGRIIFSHIKIPKKGNQKKHGL